MPFDVVAEGGEKGLRWAKGGVLTGDPNRKRILVRVVLANKSLTRNL